MLGFFERRRRVRRDASQLMREMAGMDAWREARTRAKDFDNHPEDERTHWWRVSDRMDRVLGIRWQADTATRYLES